jgi:hypothetical protein
VKDSVPQATNMTEILEKKLLQRLKLEGLQLPVSFEFFI